MKLSSAFPLLNFAASSTSLVIYGPYSSTITTTFSSPSPPLQLRDLQYNLTKTSAIGIGDKDADGDADWEPDSDPEDDKVKHPDEFELTPQQKEEIWCKAKSRGMQLTKAMMMNDQEAATMLAWPYIQSPWDGDLREELKKWGYRDDFEEDTEIDKQCDFDKTHELADALRGLGVDTRSAGQGGPNHCFYVEHMDGSTVHRDEDGELPFHEEQYYTADGKNFRVTQAYAKVGVNPIDGLVYFLHRQSPEDAAQETWGYKPKQEELPLLRSSSDITWGMWNRVASGSQKLKYFMSVSIVNTETNYIMERILEQEHVQIPPMWPGKDFEFAAQDSGNGGPKELDLLKSESAFALLGSPNGIAAGYFLIQHRRQLGWKHISKVKIWMAGTGTWANPNILFYVSDRNPFEGPNPQGRLDKQVKDLHDTQRRKRDSGVAQVPHIVLTSEDGKNVIREHVIMARL